MFDFHEIDVPVRHVIGKLSLTAKQWELYADMPGVSRVAHQLNAEIRRAINGSSCRAEAWEKCSAVMDEHRQFGATDTEPMYVLADIINKVFH